MDTEESLVSTAIQRNGRTKRVNRVGVVFKQNDPARDVHPTAALKSMEIMLIICQFPQDQGLAKAHQGVQQGAREVPFARCLLGAISPLPRFHRSGAGIVASSATLWAPTLKSGSSSRAAFPAERLRQSSSVSLFLVTYISTNHASETSKRSAHASCSTQRDTTNESGFSIFFAFLWLHAPLDGKQDGCGVSGTRSGRSGTSRRRTGWVGEMTRSGLIRGVHSRPISRCFCGRPGRHSGGV